MQGFSSFLPFTTTWRLSLALAIVATICGGIYLATVRYRTGLRNIPGPFLASISNLDRILSCASGLQMEYHLKLHKNYGPLVRVGPNHVSFSNCSLIPSVYSINAGYGKSDFYSLFDVNTPDGVRPTTFSVRNEQLHRNMRRPVASAFSLKTMKELEPMNDSCSAVIARKFEDLVGRDIDLGKWLHWYAFDVITSITFSHTMGMLEQERDIENIIEAIEGRLVYNSVIGQAPWLHNYLFGNTIVRRIANLIPAVRIMDSSRYIVAFAAKHLKRYENQKIDTGALKDMLARFNRFKDEEQLIDDADMLSHAAGNIFAGSDTTAASLRSLFYHVSKNKPVHDKLLAEIDAADSRGELSHPVAFVESQKLPYLQAVIKESLRMHPAVGMLLERVAPPGGAELGGVWFPAGTIVGMNPWVSARDQSTYGKDAGDFRPERWLDVDEQRLRLMDRNFLAFGGGARVCLGKNISMLEMSKLVPQLYRHFDFELSDPDREWELHDYWFVKQTGLICKVIKRDRNL